jgi:hypothetical protein
MMKRDMRTEKIDKTEIIERIYKCCNFLIVSRPKGEE